MIYKRGKGASVYRNSHAKGIGNLIGLILMFPFYLIGKVIKLIANLTRKN